jgi:hypothetical protein
MAVLIPNPTKGEVCSVIPFLNAVFLARYEEKRDDIPNCIVTGDETWVFHHTPETKRQCVMAPHPLSISEKSEHRRQRGKSWQLSFGTGRGLFSSISCLEETPYINAAAYCETLNRLRRAIQNGEEC